jgi:hypothetical protein
MALKINAFRNELNDQAPFGDQYLAKQFHQLPLACT